MTRDASGNSIRLAVTAGSGTITVDPEATPETLCGRTTGDLQLSGLVAEDERRSHRSR
jgi:hypothetical protein